MASFRCAERERSIVHFRERRVKSCAELIRATRRRSCQQSVSYASSASSVRTCVYVFAVTERFRCPTCSPILAHGTPRRCSTRAAGVGWCAGARGGDRACSSRRSAEDTPGTLTRVTVRTLALPGLLVSPYATQTSCYPRGNATGTNPLERDRLGRRAEHRELWSEASHLTPPGDIARHHSERSHSTPHADTARHTSENPVEVQVLRDSRGEHRVNTALRFRRHRWHA